MEHHTSDGHEPALTNAGSMFSGGASCQSQDSPELVFGSSSSLTPHAGPFCSVCFVATTTEVATAATAAPLQASATTTTQAQCASEDEQCFDNVFDADPHCCSGECKRSKGGDSSAGSACKCAKADGDDSSCCFYSDCCDDSTCSSASDTCGNSGSVGDGTCVESTKSPKTKARKLREKRDPSKQSKGLKS